MRRSLALVAVSALLTVPLVAGVAHATTGDSWLGLSGGDATVTTSTGQTLHVELTASQDLVGGTETSAVRVGLSTVPITAGWLGELHTYSFPVPNSDVVYTSSTGELTINTRTHVAPYGRVKMTFLPSSSTTTCQGQVTSESGTLSGALHFRSRTAAWGRLGASTFAFGTDTSTVYRRVDAGAGPCDGGPIVAGCGNGLDWFGPGPTPSVVAVHGTSDGSTATMVVSRSVALDRPAGATRSDALAADVRPPRLKATALSIRSGGPFSGTASITNATSTVSSGPCWTGGSSYTQTTTGWAGGDWVSPASHRLTAHFEVTPDWLAPLDVPGSSWYVVGSYA